MKIDDFLILMKYPSEWNAWKMFPVGLFEIQLNDYEPNAELSSEHFRCGAFMWWEQKISSEEELLKLIKLSYLDPDSDMGSFVRERLEKITIKQSST